MDGKSDGAQSSESEHLLQQDASLQPIDDEGCIDLRNGDMVLVLDDDDLRLERTDHNEIQSPLRCINDILREAEDLMTDGPLQASTTRDNQQVLIDEVDVEYSPRKHHQPIEIVVRHNKVFEQPTSSGSEDEEEDSDVEALRKISKKSISGAKRLSTVQEGIEASPSSSQQPSTAVQTWKKGHRRAWSMPNAKGEKMTLAVIQDNEETENGGKSRRRIVKYRLHPHNQKQATRTVAGGEERIEVTQLPQRARLRFESIAIPHPDDDDNEIQVEINEEEVTVPAQAGKGGRTIVKRFWEARWKATNFESLPEWLQDNEYLRTGHRPPLPSFSNCFKSIFALHTETGNIWTHMYGCVAFIGVALWFLTRSSNQVQFMEKLVFSAFFLGAVICLGMSFAFHTVACHSIEVGKLFSKLDYTGISLLIVGSFIPWIYYSFYCRPQPMIIYITMISVLGISAMIVSLWDKFAAPKYRPLRAGVFVAMGLSAIVPAAHLLIVDGLSFMIEECSLYWMLLMGGMYIGGATIYATRIPERCFPGKCDLWFQSHQLFHTFVVAAAFVHFHAITEMGMNKLMQGSCAEQLLVRYDTEYAPSWLGTLLGLDESPNIKSWTPAFAALTPRC